MSSPSKITVHYYPPTSKTNQYVDCNIRIWRKQGFRVVPAPFYFRGTLKLFSFKRKEHIVLNWYEDRLNYTQTPLREFISATAMLFALKCVFKRIHWVRHNLSGHDTGKTFLRTLLERMLAALSTNKISHRPMKGFSYIPHPLYPVTCAAEKKRDIPFLYFGVVKRYKGLEWLLQRWPESQPLHMVGSVSDQSLEKSLTQIIDARGLSVKWQREFVDVESLNGLLARTRCVVLPHRKDTMIVSGAAYHALSYGTKLLISDGEFADYLVDKLGCCVKKFSDESLEGMITSFAEESVEACGCQIDKEFGDKNIGEAWRRLLLPMPGKAVNEVFIRR